MVLNGVDIPEQALADFCRRAGVARLAVFGSILTPEFGHESDIDLLVEFFPQSVPSLLRFAGMQLELCTLLGRQVHLHTPAMLPPDARDQIRREAKLQYAA